MYALTMHWRTGPAAALLAPLIPLLLLFAPVPAAAQDNLFTTIATVGDEIITGYDLDQLVRIKMLERSDESREILEDEALEDLVDARAIAEEAQRYGVIAIQEDVDARIAQLAQAAGSTAEEWIERLKVAGVNIGAVRNSVETQLLWQQLLNLRFGSQIRSEIDPAEIEEEMREVEREQHLAHHIFLIEVPAETEAQRQRLPALVADVRRLLSEGESFADIARRVSRGHNAEGGGEVGWRRSQDLPPDMQAVVDSLITGAVSGPIPVADATHALLVHVAARRIIAADGVQPWSYTLAQYTLPDDENRDEEAQQTAAEVLSAIRDSEDKCNFDSAVSSPVQRDVVESVTIENLPPALGYILRDLEPGDATPVREEPGGAWFVVVCERVGGIPEELEAAFRQRVLAFVVGTRLDQLGETYLAQLRSRAVVRYADQ